MKQLKRHPFALALLLSLILHLVIIGGDLIPGLILPGKEPPSRPIEVTLQPLNIQAPARQTPPQETLPTLSAPETSLANPFPDVKLSPPARGRQPGFRLPPPLKDTDTFASLTRPDESSGPIEQTLTQQISSTPLAETPETAAASTPLQTAKTAESSLPTIETASVPQATIIATTTTERTKAKGKPDAGWRDSQGYVVPENPLENLPDYARLTFLEDRYGIPGLLDWKRQGNTYSLSLSIHIPAKAIVYQSSGLIDEKVGLKPLQYTETRDGELYRFATFTWGDKPILVYGKESDQKTSPIKPGAQDMLSLIWQMAIHGAYAEGKIQLTNGKKVYEYPVQPGQGRAFDVDNGQLRAVPVISQHEETKVEAWLAPDFANIPIRITFQKPGERKLDLQVTAIEMDGKKEWVRPFKHMESRKH